jgi:dTDP-4-dehydrorhamnose 3,5-epimerase-like enzyme
MKKIIKINTSSDKRGHLSFIQKEKLFKFERVYYIYNIKKKTIRGKHYHKKNRQLMVCLNGKVELNIVNIKTKKKSKFILNDPQKGVFIENYEYHFMICHKNSIILVLAEKKYSKKDYYFK